jgi:serine protease Do
MRVIEKISQRTRRTAGMAALILAGAIAGSLITWLIVWLAAGSPFDDRINSGGNTTASYTETLPADSDQTSKAVETTAQPTETSVFPSESSGETTEFDLSDPTDKRIAVIARNTLPSIVGVRVEASLPSSSLGSVSEGSGIIYSSDGYIITNNHVVASAYSESGSLIEGSRISVYLYENDNPYEAVVAGRDASTDLALLKINASGLKAVVFGDSDNISAGEMAIAIGNPSGLQLMGSVTAGIISGLDRQVQLENGSTMALIQTDAAVNTGNSGGALINEHGEVIGINNAGLIKSQFEGINFAIPANTAVEIIEELKNKPAESGEAWLGLSVIPDADYRILAEQNGWPARGVLVYDIQTDSPADLAGLESGDIILGFDDSSVIDTTDLSNQLARMNAGQRIKILLYRPSEDKELNIYVVLGEKLVN